MCPSTPPVSAGAPPASLLLLGTSALHVAPLPMAPPSARPPSDGPARQVLLVEVVLVGTLLSLGPMILM